MMLPLSVDEPAHRGVAWYLLDEQHYSLMTLHHVGAIPLHHLAVTISFLVK